MLTSIKRIVQKADGVMQMDIVDRIFELADKQYPEQRDFASRIGVVPSVVSAWRSRKSASYNKRLPEIANLLGATPEYLLTGVEPDEVAGYDEETKRFLARMADTTPDERIAMEAALIAIRTKGK